MFTYQRRVEFAETDLAGQVHFTSMFRYMEEAEHALWRAAGMSVADPGSEFAWPRISASMEFRNPLRFEDEFEVRIRLTSSKTRTLHYDCLIVRGDVVIAEGQMASICVKRQADGRLRAAELPGEIVAKLNAASR